MAANKVIVNNQTILDLTADTVTAATLKKGVTAHDASGAQITGTMEEASTSETWVLNNIISTLSAFSFSVSFTSNGASYTGLKTSIRPSLSGYDLWYTNSSGSYDAIYNPEIHYWADAAYRKLVFDTPPTGDLLTWLTANGVKQPANLAVQPSKDVTITSNGTVSVTPDAPYDALSSVDVTVNVASGGGGGAGFKVTFPATATNWGNAEAAYLLLSDGTVKSFLSYSEVGGKTIENVAGIYCKGAYDFYVLTMTLSEGTLAQYTIGAPPSTNYRITTSNHTTMAFYNTGKNTFWWPLADTVISAIEMYNTD